MEIRALSRSKMQDLKERYPDLLERCKVISINCSEDKPLFGDLKHHNLLTLQFDDLEQFAPSHPHLVLFDEPMARSIVQFIKSVAAEDTLLVHCHLGVSRSGAVATFAREFRNCDYDTFHSQNPQILPNLRVLGMLHAQAAQ